MNTAKIVLKRITGGGNLTTVSVTIINLHHIIMTHDDALFIIEAAAEHGVHLDEGTAMYAWAKYSLSKGADWTRLDNYTHDMVWNAIEEYIT